MACNHILYVSMVKKYMDNGFVLSEVVRKLANVIRIGKIVENDGARVRVKIGKVTTGWLPIISTAGETLIWNPISKDEQVAVFFPYGETAQGFVLRSLHYDKFLTPDDKNSNILKTPNTIKIDGEKTCEVAFKKDVNLATDENFKLEAKKNFDGKFEENFNIKVGSGEVHLSKDRISIKNGGAIIALSNDGIELSAAGGSISISEGNITINAGGGSLSVGSSISINGSSVALAGSGASIDLLGSVSISGSSISTMPPVCKCAGGL